MEIKMEMTTRTGIVCPNCEQEVMIETEGLLGGVMQQLMIQSVIKRLETESATLTCGNCEHEWNHYV